MTAKKLNNSFFEEYRSQVSMASEQESIGVKALGRNLQDYNLENFQGTVDYSIFKRETRTDVRCAYIFSIVWGQLNAKERQLLISRLKADSEGKSWLEIETLKPFYLETDQSLLLLRMFYNQLIDTYKELCSHFEKKIESKRQQINSTTLKSAAKLIDSVVDMANETLDEGLVAATLESEFYLFYSTYSSLGSGILVEMRPNHQFTRDKFANTGRETLLQLLIHKHANQQSVEVMRGIQLENINSTKNSKIVSERLKTGIKLAGYLGHEINNPLAIAYGKCEIVNTLIENAEGLHPMVKSYLEDIEKALGRIGSIMDNVKMLNPEGADAGTIPWIGFSSIMAELKAHYADGLVLEAPEDELGCPGNPKQLIYLFTSLIDNMRQKWGMGPKDPMKIHWFRSDDKLIVEIKVEQQDGWVYEKQSDELFTSITNYLIDAHTGQIERSPTLDRVTLPLTDVDFF